MNQQYNTRNSNQNSKLCLFFLPANVKWVTGFHLLPNFKFTRQVRTFNRPICCECYHRYCGKNSRAIPTIWNHSENCGKRSNLRHWFSSECTESRCHFDMELARICTVATGEKSKAEHWDWNLVSINIAFIPGCGGLGVWGGRCPHIREQSGRFVISKKVTRMAGV